jgi:hypothetical protein
MSSGFEPLAAEYYESDTSAGLAPGRICWAPITYIERVFQVAEVVGTVPSDDSATTYKIVPYKKAQCLHPPVYGLKLRAGELLRVARMKQRPVIVLSARVDPWKDRGGKTRQSEKARLVAPLYTIEDYSSGWIDRVQRFEYNSHFFLPANPLKEGKPDRDVFIRFEQIQSVHEDLLEPRAFRLTEEVLEYVCAWFCYLVRGQHNDISSLLAELYEVAP